MIAILGSPSNEASLQLVDGWRAEGLEAVLMTPDEALERLTSHDVAVARLDVLPTLDGVEPGLDALQRLEEEAGVTVVNTARALVAVHDKARTARRLAGACVPHPKTEVVRSIDELTLSPPLVLKPRYGSWGAHVVLCRDEVETVRCLDEIRELSWFRKHGVLAQEALPTTGSDLRVLVAGGCVVGAARRRAAPGEWRTNVSCGGSLQHVEISDELAELALTAVAVTDVDFAGVDLFPVADGRYVVLELNGAVEFDTRYSLGGRSVYGDAAEALGLRGVDAAVA